MDKRIVQAVAGSGKTYYLINTLNLEDRIFLITYTRQNQKILLNRIEEKFGYMPNNIKVFGLFQFLYSFCLRPLHRPILNKISFKRPDFYENDIVGDMIYSSRISKFLLANYRIQLTYRIEKYCDKIFVDEVQDLGGDDFDFILFLGGLNIDVLLVGDFYQGTYTSSTRGNKNRKIKEDEEHFFMQLKKNGYKKDTTTLSKSRRCSKEICDFVKKHLYIDIESNRDNIGDIIEIKDLDLIKKLILDDSIPKLYYRLADSHLGNTNNWGNSKGLTYDNVCVVLNKKTYDFYKKNKLSELPRESKAKFYVACTRSKGNVYLIDEELITKVEKELRKF